MERHHVPHGAPVRHGPRPHHDEGRPARGPLPPRGHQDLDHLRRARPRLEHHPPRPRAAAGRAGRHQGHLALPRAEVHPRRRAQPDLLRRPGTQDGHPRLAHLRDEPGEGQGLARRSAEQGHAGHVHHDERRPPRRRHAGPRHRRDFLPDRPRLRPRAPPEPLAGCGQARPRRPGRRDPRPPRRAPDAAQREEHQRGDARPGLLDRDAIRPRPRASRPGRARRGGRPRGAVHSRSAKATSPSAASRTPPSAFRSSAAPATRATGPSSSTCATCASP